MPVFVEVSFEAVGDAVAGVVSGRSGTCKRSSRSWTLLIFAIYMKCKKQGDGAIHAERKQQHHHMKRLISPWLKPGALRRKPVMVELCRISQVTVGNESHVYC